MNCHLKTLIFIILTGFMPVFCLSQNTDIREIVQLGGSWEFINEDISNAQNPSLSTDNWESVEIPHDWAIKGPFDKEIDAQLVRVQQDQDKKARLRTGRTGALPHVGVGWYRRSFELPSFKKGKKALLVFDGAMSDAHVWINGKKVGNHPYGYAYFYFDISEFFG